MPNGKHGSAPKRQLDDWITGYMEYTTVASESPTSFHLWGGLATIAAALQRKVFIRWGHSTIYPNNYIILVGPSGRSRKGEAIGIARSMVESLKIPLIGEDNSQEAIILEMKNAVTSYTERPSGKIVFQCAVSSFVEELSVFTGQQNTQFLAYLTNWYDSRDKWKRTTKHQGVDEIMGVCFNLLAATAPDWVPYIFPREAIGGGFSSRCIFVVEEGKSKIVPDPNAVRRPDSLRNDLRRDLEAILTMTGEFSFEEKARKAYLAWYQKQEEDIERGAPAVSDQLFQGYMARRAMHLFKIMMAYSASRGSDMLIIERDFKRALSALEMAEKKMPRVFSGIGKARYAEETDQILNFIASRGSVKKSDIFHAFRRNVDDYSLDVIMRVLSGMRVVRVVIVPGGDTRYEYVGPPPGGNPSGLIH